MSSGGQIFGAVAGGIVGFVTTGGNPGGAVKGAVYGASIGAALDPPPGPDLEGPKIADNAEQTSSYGAGVSSLSGKIAISGTWIWVENNKKKIKKKKEDSGGGKSGGGGSETTTYEAFITGCILLTDHPIDGIERVWFTSDLVANALATDLSTAAASSEKFPNLHLHTDSNLLKASLDKNPESGTVRLYPGYDDQPVDPRMEADLGAGNCPAYRGYSLLFLYDYPLERYSNSIAGLQVKAECIKSGSGGAATLLNRIVVDEPFAGSTSTPVCTYLAQDKAVVYAQASTLAFPREYRRTEYSMDNARTSAQKIEVEGNGVIHGWWDEDLPPQSEDSFSSGVNLNEASGRLVSKKGYTYAISWAVNKVYKQGIFGLVFSVTPPKPVRAAAVDGSGNLYVLHDDKNITKYDEDLTLLATKAFTITGLNTTIREVEATWDDLTNLLYLTSRDGPSGVAEILYAVDFDSGTVGQQISLSSYDDDPNINTHKDAVITVVGGVLSRYVSYSEGSVDKMAVDWWRLPVVSDSGQSLASVTRERLEKSELIEPADIDVALLPGDVTGGATSGIGSVRSKVTPLMAAYNFDIVPSGYQLKCVPRGQSSVMTIDYDDLDARPFGESSGVAIDHQREMDAQLPRQLLVDYIDAGRNYNRNQEPSIERLSSKAVNKENYEVPFVFTPDEAAEIASTQMDRRWLERDDFAFTLPQSYNRLEPADVVDIVTPYATYEWRLTSVNLLADGRVECTAKLNDPAIYTQNATGGTRVTGDTTIAFAGSSVMHLLDIPLIRDEDDKAGFAASLCGKSSGWPGGTIIRSIDSGQTFQPVQGFVGGVTSGVCSDSLPAHDGYVIDRVNTLTVNLYNPSMSLSSITEEQMLTGKHWFAYGVAGRWELGQFANATLNADGTYTLDTLVRGAKGTEQYTGLHEDGDIFILLADADAAFVAANISDIGVERIYRGVTRGKDIDTVSDTAFIYSGVNLKPPSVVQVTGSIDGSNNWNVAYIPRSRLSTSEWVTGVDIPIGEATESYEHDIMDGSTVVRTITSTSPGFQYSSADQVTDWGSNQTTITVNIYKMSATVGRGYVTEITL